MLDVADHPLLDLQAFITEFPAPLGDLSTTPEVMELLRSNAETPMYSDDDVRRAVRDLLRHGGFRPTGRSKPAAEYLLKAASQGNLTSINPAVDACNAVSLHSGLPISVVDLDRANEPFKVAVAPDGASYVFNASDQVIDLSGSLCLFDCDGPSANAVKDAQRTKTTPQTTRTMSLIWGTTALPDRATETARWYRQLLEQSGSSTRPIWPVQ